MSREDAEFIELEHRCSTTANLKDIVYLDARFHQQGSTSPESSTTAPLQGEGYSTSAQDDAVAFLLGKILERPGSQRGTQSTRCALIGALRGSSKYSEEWRPVLNVLTDDARNELLATAQQSWLQRTPRQTATASAARHNEKESASVRHAKSRRCHSMPNSRGPPTFGTVPQDGLAPSVSHRATKQVASSTDRSVLGSTQPYYKRDHARPVIAAGAKAGGDVRAPVPVRLCVRELLPQRSSSTTPATSKRTSPSVTARVPKCDVGQPSQPAVGYTVPGTSLLGSKSTNASTKTTPCNSSRVRTATTSPFRRSGSVRHGFVDPTTPATASKSVELSTGCSASKSPVRSEPGCGATPHNAGPIAFTLFPVKKPTGATSVPSVLSAKQQDRVVRSERQTLRRSHTAV